MTYIISGGVNVKVLGRLLHCLGKIGDELYIESMEKGMAFRSVNAARSAYGCFTLSKNFFEEFNSDEEPIKCKLNIKAILPIFKSTSSLEKSVERCKINLDINSDRLVFRLYCKHGIIKTYNLFFIECEILKAAFNKTNCCNCVIAESKLFADAVQNFQWHQDEITLAVTQDKVILRNYLDDEPDPTKVVHTEMILEPEEFSTYNITQNSEVTFCLKELRAVLSFTEISNYDLSIHFEDAGKPIVFSFIESPSSFEADFVLATISEKEDQTPVSNLTPERSKAKKKSQTKRNVKKKQTTTSAKINTSSSSYNISEMLSKPSTSSDRSRVLLGTLAEMSPPEPDSPKTPQAKKVKNVFMALLETPKPVNRNNEILASDSDENG